MNKLNALLLAAILAGAAVSAVAAPLEIDYKQSKIDVDVSATIDSFTGHLEKYSGSVDCDPSTNRPAKAEVTFNFADLKTGKTDRDAEMLKWLNYSNTPTARFTLTGWTRSGATNLALGQFTFHGVTNELSMPVTVTNAVATGNWDIAGTADFDYRTFNLPKIRKMLMLTVDPHLKVKFHLVGKLPAATK